MKTRAKFAMLVLSAAVLAGAWLLALYMSGELVWTRAQAVSAPASPTDLSAGSYRELTALSWSYHGQTVNLARSETTGRWINADDDTCPIDDGAAQALARAAAGVTASMAIPDVTDLAQYGLDAPELIVVAASEETFAGYEFGHRSITGEYYMRLNAGDTVYVTDGAMASAFRVGLGDILALESIPSDIDTVTGLTVQTGADGYALALTQTDDGMRWQRTDGDDTPLEEDMIRTLYEPITALELSRCVSWSAGDAAACGLDAPQVTAELAYRDASGRQHAFTLEFGAYEDSDVYVRFAGSDMVYLVPASVPDALMYPAWAAMTRQQVIDLEPDSLSSVTVGLGGHSYEILRLEEQTEVPIADGEDTVTVTDVIYSSNGWVLDTAQMEAWLGALRSLTADGAVPAGAGRETMLTVSLAWKDEQAEPVTVELKRYDSAHCLCQVGERQLLVPRADADELAGAAEAMLIVE